MLTVLAVLIAELASFKILGQIFVHFFSGGHFHLPVDLECFLAHGALALGHAHALPAGLEPFMNPPPLFLLSAPLSQLPPGMAFALWSALGVFMLCLAGFQLKLPPHLVLAALLLPPCIYCFTLGQLGVILSALLLLSLYWVRRRPVLAGIAAGLMVLKPPFALLLPICYLAAGQPRAIVAAALTGISICLLTFLLFGAPPWIYFFHVSLPEARAVLQAPWHLTYQNIMASPFILFRSLGAGLPLSYALQGALTLLACGLTWQLWRQAQAPEPDVLLVTACLAALATPYDYVYDFPAIGLLLLANWPRAGWRLAAALCFVLGTGLYVLISVVFVPIGALLTAWLCLAYWPAPVKRESSRRNRSGLFRWGSQT